MSQIKFSPATRLFGLIGHPVAHSLSPKIQNELIDTCGGDAVYLAFDIEKDDVGSVMQAVRAMRIGGLNVTAPYKEAVMPYLDSLDGTAQRYHAVNVIQNIDGHLRGYNVDIAGVLKFFEVKGVPICGKDVLVLGAGGLARALLNGLSAEKAGSLTVFNRTAEKAQELARRTEEEWGFPICAEPEAKAYDLVINATSAGMHPQEDACPVPFPCPWIDSHTIVFDSIYNPSETVLLKESKRLGAKTYNGLGMLVLQALLSYEIFTDQKLESRIYQKFADYGSLQGVESIL